MYNAEIIFSTRQYNFIKSCLLNRFIYCFPALRRTPLRSSRASGHLLQRLIRQFGPVFFRHIYISLLIVQENHLPGLFPVSLHLLIRMISPPGCKNPFQPLSALLNRSQTFSAFSPFPKEGLPHQNHAYFPRIRHRQAAESGASSCSAFSV